MHKGNKGKIKEDKRQMTDDKGGRTLDFGLVGRGVPPSRDDSPGGLAPPCGPMWQGRLGLARAGGQSSGLEGIDGHDAAIELPVIQVFCENCIAAKSFGSGDDLRIVVLNAIDSLYLDCTGDKRIVND